MDQNIQILLKEMRSMPPDLRLEMLIKAGLADRADAEAFRRIPFQKWTEILSRRVENVFAAFPKPFAVAKHFVVNGKAYHAVPMCTEEPTIVAGASKAAKLAGPDGFRVKVSRPLMNAQVFFHGLSITDARDAERRIEKSVPALIETLRKKHPRMVERGGGLVGITTDIGHHRSGGARLVVTLTVDVRDAMGANIVTRASEAAKEPLSGIVGRPATYAICSNDSPERYVIARAIWPFESVSRKEAERILLAQEDAECVFARAVTHNKGIMNGVTAVAEATGQDTRAIEAAAHAEAAFEGSYRPLTRYSLTEKGLYGRLRIPMPVGTVGGATTLPGPMFALSLLGAKDAAELSAVMGAVGLAQNFAALRCLVNEGICEARKRVSRTE